MTLKSHWKRRADASYKEPQTGEGMVVPIDIFTARGAELDEIGVLLHSPRLVQHDPMGQRMYRLQLMGAVLASIGTLAQPTSDLEMNSAAVAVGTYRNDNPDYYYETTDAFRDRVQTIALDWLAIHGDAGHICEECCK